MALKKLTWWDQFKLADDSTDVRGWRVIDRDCRAVGEVEDLIFDVDDRRVRYASVALDHPALGDAVALAEGDRRGKCVLVPVGGLDVDAGWRAVRIGDMSGAELATLRAYEGQAEIDEAFERAVYRDYHQGWAEAGRIDYGTARYHTASDRLRAIERRYAETTASCAAVFAASEPDAEERARRQRARDASGDDPA